MEKLSKAIIFSVILLGFTFYVLSLSVAHAQLSSIGIASYLSIESDKVEDGDIIIATPEGYFLSQIPYDSQVAGVVTKSPAISIRTENKEKTFPVVSEGTVYTRVTGENGNIKKDDFITTSSTPGTGMKADKSGYVVGQSLQDVSFKDPKEIKLIPVTLNFHFLKTGDPMTNSFSDVFTLSKIAAFESPNRVLQYVVAAIITIMTFGLGFLIFAKLVNTGIEAIGRNPLAGRMIQLSIVFNLILIAFIIIAGVSLAYLVIRL